MTSAGRSSPATVGGARALRRGDIGRIAVGGRADLAVLEAPSYEHLAYRPGMPLAPNSTCLTVRARGRNRRWQTN